MSIKALNPYLNFDGNAAEAIAHYEKALGAQLQGGVMRYSEMPGDACPAELKDRIMHARLQVGGGWVMISDTQPDRPSKVGTNVEITLHFDDPEDMAKRFDALAAGGRVDMALHDAFWGGKFGALTDKFGVHWLFHYEIPKAS